MTLLQEEIKIGIIKDGRVIEVCGVTKATNIKLLEAGILTVDNLANANATTSGRTAAIDQSTLAKIIDSANDRLE